MTVARRRNPYGLDGADQMQRVITLYDAVSAVVPVAKLVESVAGQATGRPTTRSQFMLLTTRPQPEVSTLQVVLVSEISARRPQDGGSG
ncbi:hypothetical protein [Nocardia sp. NBC_01009]|uniref:hypothetical protein n=1 Tax=Nocardia sp. NBC_01009 TaxID=2975996 RepID=UPI00386EAB95|nr:hypothetical protein OHA42_08810 [Nocardia sp. NBC_01009]